MHFPLSFPPSYGLLVAVATTLLSVTTTLAQSITLEPAKDNTIQNDAPPGGTIASNGAGSYLFAGNTAGGATRRGLLQFDLQGAVPDNAVITGVTLRMRMSKSISGVTPVSLHRALADWGEAGSNSDGEPGKGAPAQIGDATWEHTFFDDQMWDQAGGDFLFEASGTTGVAGAGLYAWSGDGLIADVQAWLEDAASNFGWFVIGDESSSASAKRFDSRDHDVVANRPILTIQFDLPIVLGDMDGNGTLDAFDVDDFELALADPQAYDQAHPDLDRVALGDFDMSGSLDAFDVGDFEIALASGGASVPEPTTSGLLALGLAAVSARARRGIR